MTTSAQVDLTSEEIQELLRYANLGETAQKLVDALIGLATPPEPHIVSSVVELEALPVETAIRMGTGNRQRCRVKSVNGEWVGAGGDGPSSITSDKVLYWYSRVEVLHVGTGWNP